MLHINHIPTISDTITEYKIYINRLIVSGVLKSDYLNEIEHHIAVAYIAYDVYTKSDIDYIYLRNNIRIHEFDKPLQQKMDAIVKEALMHDLLEYAIDNGINLPHGHNIYFDVLCNHYGNYSFYLKEIISYNYISEYDSIDYKSINQIPAVIKVADILHNHSRSNHGDKYKLKIADKIWFLEEFIKVAETGIVNAFEELYNLSGIIKDMKELLKNNTK